MSEEAPEPRLRPVERPMMLGEVFTETIRVYGARIWFAFGMGVAAAAGISLAALVDHLVAKLAIFTWMFAALFGIAVRYIEGDTVGSALRKVGVRAPELFVLGLVVTLPLAIGVFDPLIGLVAAFWLGFVSFAIPVTVAEELPGGITSRIAGALQRSSEISRLSYLHAVGVVAAFVIVFGLFGNILLNALRDFGDNGYIAAFLISQGFLVPFLFLGLAVLFFEQRARAISSP